MKLAAGLALALGTLAVGAVPVDHVAAKDDEPKKKKVCRTYKVTGSLTRTHRVCRTEAEWRQADEAVSQGVSDLQGGASGAPKCISMVDAACPEKTPGAF